MPARLLLPAPNRESRRIVRFATSALEPTAIVVAPAAAALSMPDILAAADILIVPSQALYDPDTVAGAMTARLPIVTAGLTPAESPLLDETTCLRSLTTEPLNLARAMLHLWQDKAMAASLVSAAAGRIAAPLSQT